LKTEAVDQAIKTIRNRADKYGVSEPTIAKRGADNILIQLPGVKDPNRAIDIIGKTAQLEFNMVADDSKALDSLTLPEGVTRHDDSSGRGGRVSYLSAATKEQIFDTVKGHLPDDLTVKLGEERDAEGKVTGYRTWLVKKQAGLTGDYLTNASVTQDREKGGYEVAFSLDPEGAKIFGKLTEENIGKRMAIVLDDIVDSAPVINSKIPNGSGVIQMGGYKTQQEILEDAKNLALVLKSGALAAPVVIREQRRIGATLGGEAVKKGQMAMAIGIFLVIAWMAIYYKWSGVIADVALLFNFVFLVALLAGLEATLTLPGMAGVALTLGMAVDANVIILERIREELRHGKTVRAAIDAGYDKAFWTIVDSHITAIVSGVILWQYGSGPVRGFATTLIIGIAASLYTSVVITKMIYQFMMSRSKMETISI
jgi:preprotein translocase subunit SecD